jgi:hypothetical protein
MNTAPRRLRVAVTGAGLTHSPDGREGWAVRAHVPALKALPELFEVVAVCTTRMETARASAVHFGVPHAYAGVEDMLRERLLLLRHPVAGNDLLRFPHAPDNARTRSRVPIASMSVSGQPANTTPDMLGDRPHPGACLAGHVGDPYPPLQVRLRSRALCRRHANTIESLGN